MRIITILVTEISTWLFALCKGIPGRIGAMLRYYLYKPFLARCGKKVCIPTGCEIRGFKNVSLGDNARLGIGTQIYASGDGQESIEIGKEVTFNSNVMVNADWGGTIKIGDYVSIGPNVVIRTSNHRYDNRDKPIKFQGHKSHPIIIEEDAWIGANAVVLPGVVIGKGAVIAAGAVVTKDIESYTIAAGVPAKGIGRR